MSTTPSASPAYRAAGSVRTRLQRAALDLFDEQGYDGTTVDEIAERAGVGRTTFFRAFRSKEDVIFPHHDELLEQVRARLDAATSRHGLVAVSEAASLVLRHYLDEGDLAVRRYRLTRSVPSLRDREVAGLRQYQMAFRDHIRTWMDDELRAELMAVSVTTACNAVLRRLLRGGLEDPWPVFHAAMGQVLELFAEPALDGGPTVVVVGDLGGGGADPAEVGAAVERALRARA